MNVRDMCLHCAPDKDPQRQSVKGSKLNFIKKYKNSSRLKQNVHAFAMFFFSKKKKQIL